MGTEERNVLRLELRVELMLADGCEGLVCDLLLLGVRQAAGECDVEPLDLVSRSDVWQFCDEIPLGVDDSSPLVGGNDGIGVPWFTPGIRR